MARCNWGPRTGPSKPRKEKPMPDFPEDFKKACDDLIDNWEGGYVNDPHDAGGETNMGISKRSYPDVDIKHLTREDAEEIYYRDFWMRRSRHWDVRTPSSDSARSSQLPCFGV